MKDISLKSADSIRILSAAMVEKANSGHPGGAMGGADFVNILYSEFLNFDPQDGDWMLRDRFFLDPGHMSPMLYSILSFAGYFSSEELKCFRQWESPTPGHPEKDFEKGIENTSGPLGQGHTMAVGAAIAERFMCERFGEWMAHKTYTYISDGGIQEEISQGAGRIAGHLGLSNLIMFYDSNDIQLSTATEEVTSEDTSAKYIAWGWKVLSIDGNNPDEIRQALKTANAETEKPTLIIGKTIMGKGAVDADGKSFESKTSTHGQPLSAAGASFDKTVANLGGNPNDPFEVSAEIKDFWTNILKKKSEAAKSKNIVQSDWELTNKDLSKKLSKFLSMDLSQLNFDEIEQKDGVATRGASSAVLAYLADNVENIIVSSADLSNSDKTDGFLKNTKAITKNDFSGKFLQAGVAELTMACIANGIALHGGVIPVCATFFVFSDYMKPAVRLSALMELPVKYVWTHDSFRVGEDGPTHQPIEHEAQIRLMEHLFNHSGKRSTVVLRPADADETTVAWEMALRNEKTPSCLILSRQNIKSLPASTGSRYEAAKQANKGGYVVYQTSDKTDILLLGNGSEVSTLFDAAKMVEDKLNLNVKVVSLPSEGLFLDQSAEYQNSVISNEKVKIGLTAGLPINLKNILGKEAKIIGLESFGFSAPAGVLDKKLGYTPESVFNEIEKIIS